MRVHSLMKFKLIQRKFLLSQVLKIMKIQIMILVRPRHFLEICHKRLPLQRIKSLIPSTLMP